MAAKKLRILLITSTYPRWAGDSTPGFVEGFARTLTSENIAVTVIAPHSKGAAIHERQGDIDVRRYRYFLPESEQTIAYDGGGVSKIKATPVYALKLLCLIASQFFVSLYEILSKKIDIINAHWLIPQGFIGVILKMLTGRKLVITVHGSDVLTLNGGLLRKVKRFTLKHADKVVVNSSATLAACQDLYPHRDYALIPMGVDMDRFAPAPKSKRLIKKHKLRGLTILFVGRLTKEKGLDKLVDAIGLLKNEKNYTLLVVGEGPEKATIQQQAVRLGLKSRVVFAGWVPQDKLTEYYTTADIMVGPSLHEALGLVFIEAAACGLPVLATNTGGVKDVVKHDVTGLLIDQPEPELIAQELRPILTKPAALKRLSKNSRAHVVKNYSWQHVGELYAKLLRSFKA